MKKLFVVLFVSFLLIAPGIAQAKSDKKCKVDDASCTASQDDGHRDRDRDDDDSHNDGDREGRDRDKDDRGKRDKDKDSDKGEDRNRRDHDEDDDDDRDHDDDDDRDKRDKDKDDRDDRDRDDDDDEDGEDRGEPDEDEDDSDEKPKKDGCRKIEDGGIYTRAKTGDGLGDEIIMGFDAFGYNYQAHKFQGFAPNASRIAPPVTEGNVYLKMKWNETYVSNKDCNGDHHLDQHYGYDSYYGTDAWLTNMYKWSYIGDDGEVHWVHWFLKATAKPYEGFDCASIGAAIYNSHFCWVKNEYRDPYGGSQGLEVLLSLLGFRN